MKIIIMFVMVLAISAPALADDLNPPDWAGGPGTIYGIWEFPSASSGLVGDYPEIGKMVPHDTHPDPDEHTNSSDPDEIAHQHFMIDYVDDTDYWTANYEGREGVLVFPGGFGIAMYNFPGEGSKLIRMQVTAWTESGELDFWLDAVPVASPLIAEIEDVGDGWSHFTYEFELDENPADEWLWLECYEGAFAIDQMVIDTICYSGVEPPSGPGTRPTSDPRSAKNADPASGAEHVDPTAVLNWETTVANPSFDVYFGTISPPPLVSAGQSTANYDPPGNMALVTTHFWKIDVWDGGEKIEGRSWAFTTGGKAYAPIPPVGGACVSNDTDLSWTGDTFAGSYDVYFGTSPTPTLVSIAQSARSLSENPPSKFISAYDYLT